MIIKIYTDGGSRGNPGKAAIGVCLYVDDVLTLQEGKYIGIATNNDAEYQAFHHSLSLLHAYLVTADKDAITSIKWLLDSKLVVEQLNKKWKIKEDRIRAYAAQIWPELATLPYPFTIEHIPREKNAQADSVVNETLDSLL